MERNQSLSTSYDADRPNALTAFEKAVGVRLRTGTAFLNRVTISSRSDCTASRFQPGH